MTGRTRLYEQATAGSAEEGAVPPRVADYHAWGSEQAAHIRAGRLDLVDILNVADEIEDVGKSDYRAMESRLEIVLLHILKWDHQPERRSRSWSDSIFENRLRLEKLLRQSPSLKRRLEEAVAGAFADARRLASRETGLPLSSFADRCPYAMTDILDKPYEIHER